MSVIRRVEGSRPARGDGFLDARITDISKRAGLSHGAFYHYFTSKEQLFREVAEIQEARLTAPHEDPALTNSATTRRWSASARRTGATSCATGTKRRSWA